LLQQGQEWEAAERALGDVLALDPGNEESTGNLQLLRQRRGQAAAAPQANGTRRND
jgi:hypothetical protein